MNKNLRIAIFTDSFLPGTGGTENAVINMCYGLQNNGNIVKVYCPNYHRQYENNKIEIFRVPSIKLSENDMAGFPSLVKNKLLKDVKNFNPDIIHFCTGSGMAKWATKIGKSLNIPVVGTIHTKFRDAFSDSIKSKLIVNMMLKSIANKLTKCQMVSVVGKCQIPDIKSYGYKKDNFIVIKNGVVLKEKDICSQDDVTNIRTEFNIKDEMVFLYVGHVSKFKNIQFTLKSLYILKSKGYKNFKFLIVGDGPYRKKLNKLVKKYDLENNVIFVGLVKDRKRLNAIYQTASLFLFPSIFDNDTLVVCEAGLNNIPSLVLEETGASERIKNNYNGFTSSHDHESFANRIIEIMTNETLYNSVKNNLSTLIPKDWNMVAKDYENFYNDAILKYKKDEK